MSPHDARGMWKASFITTNVIISHSSSSIMHSYNGIVLVLFIIGRSFYKKIFSRNAASLVSVIAYSTKNTLFFSQIGSNEGILYKTFYIFPTLIWTMILLLTVILLNPRHTYLVWLWFLGERRRCPRHKAVLLTSWFEKTFAQPSDHAHGVWGTKLSPARIHIERVLFSFCQ